MTQPAAQPPDPARLSLQPALGRAPWAEVGEHVLAGVQSPQPHLEYAMWRQ